MKINRWKIVAITLGCLFLIQLGYDLNSWLKPTRVNAEETSAPAIPGRFQMLQTNTKMDVLLDTATGRVFNLYGTSVLQQFPTKSCVDADCRTEKGTLDARQ
jgi:hypothetical protein